MSANQPRRLRVAKTDGGIGWVVELDGHDIASALRGLSLNLDGSLVGSARLDIVIEDISTHAEVDAWMPKETKDLLVRLGWTPPAEEAAS